MSVLVVYYSQRGHTRKLAQSIAQGLKADIEEILDTDKRAGCGGYLRSGFQSLFGKTTRLEPTQKDPHDYDLVIVGSPIWGTLSAPVQTYLKQNAGRFKRVACFVSHGGSGEQKAFQTVRRLSGREPLATLEVKEREFKSDVALRKIETFVRQLDVAGIAV